MLNYHSKLELAVKLDEWEASSLVTGGKLLVALQFRMHWKGLVLKMYFFILCVYRLRVCIYTICGPVEEVKRGYQTPWN